MFYLKAELLSSVSQLDKGKYYSTLFLSKFFETLQKVLEYETGAITR